MRAISVLLTRTKRVMRRRTAMGFGESSGNPALMGGDRGLLANPAVLPGLSSLSSALRPLGSRCKETQGSPPLLHGLGP